MVVGTPGATLPAPPAGYIDSLTRDPVSYPTHGPY